MNVGPYTILNLLGKGGMGEVSSARDDRLGRDVAIESINSQLPTPKRLRLDRLRVLASWELGGFV